MAREMGEKPEKQDDVSKFLAGDRDRIINAHEDVPDIRDRMNEPELLDLKAVLDPLRIELSPVLDQSEQWGAHRFRPRRCLFVHDFDRVARDEDDFRSHLRTRLAPFFNVRCGGLQFRPFR